MKLNPTITACLVWEVYATLIFYSLLATLERINYTSGTCALIASSEYLYMHLHLCPWNNHYTLDRASGQRSMNT